MSGGDERIEIEVASADDAGSPWRRGAPAEFEASSRPPPSSPASDAGSAWSRSGGPVAPPSPPANEEPGTVWRRDPPPAPAPAAPPAASPAASPVPGVTFDGASPDGVATPPSEPTRVLGSRQRLALAVAGGAFLAIGLGWLIGRSGDDSASITNDSTPETTESTATDATLPAVSVPTSTEPRPAPTTSRPPRTTTTTEAPTWRVRTIAVDHNLAGQAMTLVAVDQSGELHELDVATGELASIQTTFRSQPMGLQAGEGWAVVWNPERNEAELYQGRHDPVAVEIGNAWESRWQPGSDRFWRFDEIQMWGSPRGAAEYSALTGEPTGRVVELPFNAWSTGVDGSGNLLVQVAGGTYAVDGESSRRLTTGSLLATHPLLIVAHACGDDLESCGPVVVDLASGDERLLDIVDDTPIQPMSDFTGAVPAVSPNGRFAPVMIVDNGMDGGPAWGLLDLENGLVVPIGEYPEMPPVWSPDGRFMLFNEQATLMAVDTATFERFEVAPDLDPLAALSVVA